MPPWYELETPFELAITGPLFDYFRVSEKPQEKDIFKSLI